VLTIPPEFSRRVLEKNQPRVALIADNTDTFVSNALGAMLSGMMAAYGQPAHAARVPGQATLDVVEVYPYVPYIQYLLPGSVVMSVFMMVMIGGGIIFIDDKARGLHEGYLVTPITKFELIAGFNISGTIKAVLAGLVPDADRIGDCRHPESVRSAPAGAAARRDRHHLVCADQPDVPVDGARVGSAAATRGVRRAQHAPLFPERRRLSAAGLSRAGCR
jgi:hypothetical protein